MEAIKEFLHKIDNYIQPITDAIQKFFGNGWYIIYICIFILLAIIILAGLITVFRKIPKFFFILFFILALISVVCYFLAYH